MATQMFEEGVNYVLLLSGGLDSTIMFYDLVQSNSKFRCVWIDYGQKNARQEQKVVAELCSKHFVPLQSIFVPLVFKGVESTLLEGVSGAHSVASDEVLNRNAVLISIAASHCVKQSTILVGAHKTGASYADATPQFYTRMSKAIHWSTNSRVDVKAPYIKLTKRQIVNRAWDLAVTPEEIMQTVSCYEGRACGVCPACIARSRALEGTPFNNFFKSH